MQVWETYAIREGLLETLGCCLLYFVRNCTVARGVGGSLAVLVGGRHSDGRFFKDVCLLDQRSVDGAESRSEGHLGRFL